MSCPRHDTRTPHATRRVRVPVPRVPRVPRVSRVLRALRDRCMCRKFGVIVPQHASALCRASARTRILFPRRSRAPHGGGATPEATAPPPDRDERGHEFVVGTAIVTAAVLRAGTAIALGAILAGPRRRVCPRHAERGSLQRRVACVGPPTAGARRGRRSKPGFDSAANAGPSHSECQTHRYDPQE